MAAYGASRPFRRIPTTALFLITQQPLGVECRNWSSCPIAVVAYSQSRDLETKRIKRVPVLRDGKLVGIVSSAYLVRALAATKDDPGEWRLQRRPPDSREATHRNIPKKKGKPRASPVYGASKSISVRQYSRLQRPRPLASQRRQIGGDLADLLGCQAWPRRRALMASSYCAPMPG